MDIFSPIKPYQHFMLPVTGGHEIYVELSGNPEGEPIVFLHGGPGSGCAPISRQLFDPKRYKIIMFDQRGCGKSTPHGSLENNTTQDLMSDMEAIREKLELNDWHVFGGSWGSTLGLAYTYENPKRVRSLKIYGIFLCRQSELESFYFPSGAAAQLFPEVYAEFFKYVPNDYKHDPIAGYFEEFRKKNFDALAAWTIYEKTLSALRVDNQVLSQTLDDPDYILSHSLIENHYFLSHGFIDGDDILNNLHQKFDGDKLSIIQGRYDLVCPAITAHELHHAMPRSSLQIIDAAGHTWKEEGTRKALLAMINDHL